MALLTPKQLEQLRQIITDASTAVAISTVGHEVTPEELQRLVDEGWVDPEQVDDVILTGYQYGNLLSKLPAAAEMDLGQFIRHLQANPIKLSEAEQHAVQAARERAGQYCVGLGSRYNDEANRFYVQNDQELAAQTRSAIREGVSATIANRTTRRQLAQDLGKLTNDWARDWRRIANTEVHMAQQEGYLEDVRERHGDDELLAKIPEPTACDDCKRLYLDAEGQPIVKPASWWAGNGASNAGRKRSDWLPVLGAMHPWCQCRLIRVPKGWELRGDFPAWDLVPEGMEKGTVAIGAAAPAVAGQSSFPTSRGDEAGTAGPAPPKKPPAATPRRTLLDPARGEPTPGHAGGETVTLKKPVRRTLLDPARGPATEAPVGIGPDPQTRVTLRRPEPEPQITPVPFPGKSRVAEPANLDKGEKLSGGEGDHRPDSDFNAAQLKEGAKHELEHTTDRAVAKEIAKDHLTEDPDYYRKLKQIEKARKLHGRRKFQGFDVSIENRAGSVRHWEDEATGTKGQTKMVYPYGYIRLTEGTDGDQVDVFLGPDEKAKNVYVVHQLRAPDFKTYDEDKCMMGFSSAAAAKKAYLLHFDSPRFFGTMTTLPVEEFRKKVYSMKRRMIKAAEDRKPNGTRQLPLFKGGPASEPNTTPGYGGGYQPRVTAPVATMGQHDRNAPRTAGANVVDRRTDHTEEWPPYQDRKGKQKKVRQRISAEGASDVQLAGVSEDELVAAAERLDVRGLRQTYDWANKPKLDRIPELNQAEARTDAGEKNLETIEEIGRQRRKTAAGMKLTLNPKLIRREQKR